MAIKIIITGATGLVGEGVLLECLRHPDVARVMIIGRRFYALEHPKLEQCIVADFINLDNIEDKLRGFDACFYCAGISSRGMSEADYSRITYDTTMHFATRLSFLNPGMIFSHVSGSHTDGTEKGSTMWARVKGKTENALMRLPFKKVYNFRPAIMKPTAGQKNVKGFFKIIARLFPLFKLVFPNQVSTMREVGLAMINSILKGYPEQILEVKDIKILAAA